MKKCLLVIGVTLLMCAGNISALATTEIAQLSDITLPMENNPIDGVPQYPWYYGCSPTSGGMLIGYWDSHLSGNWSNLVEGDISSWNTIAQDMVASPEHISDYWGEPDPNPGGHLDNCIADFMHTSRSGEGLGDGGTWSNMIPTGLKDYALWDDPTTAINEAYYADSWLEEVGYFSGPFTWDVFKSQIDAESPMLLDVAEWHGSATGWLAHSVVGYGYQEDLFNIRIYDGSWRNVTVGGFAIWDTWDISSSQSSWLGWDGGTVYSYVDGSGVEWWPFLDITLANGYSYDSGYWDWAVMEGVYFQPGSPIPEPGTWFLLGTGLLGLATFGVRRKRCLYA